MDQQRRRLLGGSTLALTLSSLRDANAAPVGNPNFKKVKSLQQTPLWCWAACIEMILNLNGVNWTQPDIVAAVKGRLGVEAASDQEITAFLNSWGFTKSGVPWKAISIFKAGPPSLNNLRYELSRARPLILKIRTGPLTEHVIVCYVADIEDMGDRVALRSIYSHDPWDGEIRVMTGQQMAQQVNGYWMVQVLPA